MSHTPDHKDARQPGMFTGKEHRPKPSFAKAGKSILKAPFQLLGGITEKIVAPTALMPYQIVTDAVVHNKVKDPFKFNYDLEIGGMTVPTKHKLDASKSSVDRGFSFKRGFTTDYNLIMDHEISLGKATPTPALLQKIAERKLKIAESNRKRELERAANAEWWAKRKVRQKEILAKHGLPPRQQQPAQQPSTAYPTAFTNTDTKFPLRRGGQMYGESMDRDMAGREAAWDRTHHKPPAPPIAQATVPTSGYGLPPIDKRRLGAGYFASPFKPSRPSFDRPL